MENNNKNKLLLPIIIVAAVLVVAAVILICVFSCGGNGGSSAGGIYVDPPKPLFPFELTIAEVDDEGETTDEKTYPVTWISASDFYDLVDDERYTVTNLFADKVSEDEAKFYHVQYTELSGTDLVGSGSGIYLEKNGIVYDINYTNCSFYEHDADLDGETETVFYTCEISGNKNVCTYFIMDGEEELRWCRYFRAWAVGNTSDTDISSADAQGVDVSSVVNDEEAFIVSLMITGIRDEVYGKLVCDTSGDEKIYYIEAGEYNDMLRRIDGIA